MHPVPSSITIRSAVLADLEALTRIKAPAALHRDRLRDAGEAMLRYLVIERDQQVVGYGMLVFHRPSTWPDHFRTDQLPQVVDLLIASDWRGQGLGTVLITEMETLAKRGGYDRLYLCVDPVDNPRAYSLYLRQGFLPLQSQPYRDHWEFTDSDGNFHSGDESAVDMVKT
jgi:GNAT superfamily N-acetyltransferase